MPRDIMPISINMSHFSLPHDAPVDICAVISALLLSVPPGTRRFGFKVLLCAPLAPTRGLTEGLVTELAGLGLVDLKGVGGCDLEFLCNSAKNTATVTLNFNNTEALLSELLSSKLGVEMDVSVQDTGFISLIKSTVFAEIISNINSQLPFEIVSNTTPIVLEELASERSLREMFMLSWIAVQSFSSRDIRVASLTADANDIFMIDLCDKMYVLHEKYKSQGKTIKSYCLPREFQPSGISYVIERSLQYQSKCLYDTPCPWQGLSGRITNK